ncbi:MAG: carotenoid biosynthesis protein [Candidatus Kariarchaeaceae archaeon]|jgi:hypothetical protein
MQTTLSRLFEIFYVLLFVLSILYYRQKKDWRTIIEMFSIALFALLIEITSIFIYEAYHYSPHFILQLGVKGNNVPVVISLCWSMIITSSMKVSDTINLNEKTRPLLDALIALNIDLSMDAIAIRIEGGFWTWNNYLDNDINYNSFIGVKYGNFIGWYFIVLIFSALLRLGRLKLKDINLYLCTYLGTIPFIAFIPFYVCFEAIQQLHKIINIRGFFAITILLLISVAILFQVRAYMSETPQKNGKTNKISIYTVYSFHMFFFAVLIVKKMFMDTPILLVPSGLAILGNEIINKFTR